MNKSLVHATAALFSIILAFFTVSASGQTVSLNDGITLQPKTNRVGMNIGSITFYDNGQLLKNLIGSFNPGFEPLINRQVWNIRYAGTANSFTVNNIYDGAPVNYWAGATFAVYAGTPGAPEDGCTGLVASNTGPNSPVETSVAPVITFASSCAAPLAPNDIITMTKKTFPTPESWWENPTGGLGGGGTAVRNGAREYSDTTDLCATCGTQSLTMDATVKGSEADLFYGYDGAYNTDVFVLMNGNYQLSFWAKAASGTPKLITSASRLSSNGFNCGTQTFTPTNTWTQYTWTCTANENAATLVPNGVQIEFQTTGGALYLDNVDWHKMTSVNNPTVFRDEVIETLQNYFAVSTPGPHGIFRDWTNQNGETIDNWIQPNYAHSPTGTGGGYYVGATGSGAAGLQMEDYLVICQTVGADPYFVFPVTATNQEGANLIEFLAGSSSTPYGAKRAALGQVEPWTTVFGTIHLSLGNEDWNNYSFDGQAIYDNHVQPYGEGDYDYTLRAGEVFAAMRGAPDYDHTKFDFVENSQTATTSSPQSVARAQPDSVEMEDYTMSDVDTFDTDAHIWGPAFVEPWLKVTSPQDPKHFYTSATTYKGLSVCGYDGQQQCGVNIYEWGEGTTQSSAAEQNAGTGLNQVTMDIINAGSGQGIVTALQPLLNMQYLGIEAQSFFALDQLQSATGGNVIPGSCNSSGTGCSYQQLLTKLWGGTIDMGGFTNNIRPTMLGVQLVNQSIIGPMFSCPINNNLTYTSPASLNGNGDGSHDNGFRTPQLSNVPYLYSFCFENVTSRSVVLINTDINNSHTVNFSGNNGPTGSVIQRQYAPSSLDLLNEAPNGTNDQNAQMKVNITTSTLPNPTSITLPPHSVTALDYTAASAPYASTPQFSPAAGIYTVPTPVSISSTPGATIYYTTDGSTPTTSSNVYSGPITIAVNESLTAIATDTGFNNSAISSAAYSIAPVLPTPTFNLAAGTYTTPQPVTIANSASGITTYYTTDGSTPSLASPVYSGPITVGVNLTLQAMVVKPGFTNSAVASIAYVIAPVLPTPTFSVAGGAYSSAQTVTLSDSTPGTTIYFTVNGSTPTTLSTQYTGPITVNSTETLQAIAVATGYTNSSVATAPYSISGSTAYIGFLSGGFTASSLSLNGGATVTSAGALQLTDGGAGEGRSAWFKSKVPVQSFVTDFTFQQLNPMSNGMTFTIQGQGPGAVGGAGSGLGYQGITNSVAVKFDFYNSAGEGTDSTGVYANGVYPTVPAVNLSSTLIQLLSGDIMDAHLVYDGTNLTMTLTDTVTSAALTEVFPVNIPSLVGATTAYVGFTGGTGGNSATQNVLSWSYVNSAVKPAAVPAFSPVAGTYTTSQSVTINDSTPGTTFYYTVDGTIPTTASTIYSGAITISANETLQAIAVEAGYLNSTVASGAYSIAPVLPTPTFSLAAGTYSTSQLSNIADSMAGTTIYYTTNGTTPTTASTIYSGAVTISANETLQAIAAKTGYTNSVAATGVYIIAPVLPSPTFSLAPGTYPTPQPSTIADSMAGTTIYYTTNGTTPTTASTKYSSAITISANETLQAIAVKTGYTNSIPATGAYIIAPVLPSPTFSIAAGTYSTSQLVYIGYSVSYATLYYTTNGSTPTTASTKYSGAAITVSANETLQAIAVKAGYTNSPPAAAAYIIATVLPMPTFSVAAGTYNSSQSVTIADSTPGTSFYYTTNGTTPTTSSTLYSGPVTVSASETLQAIAVGAGYTNSVAAKVAYIIFPVLPTPTFSSAAGTYNTSQSVTITDSMAGTTIYYTTNGTVPTTNSQKYSSAVTVSANETLQAVAMKTGYTNSVVGKAAYLFTLVLSTPTFSSAAGTYGTPQSVAIADSMVGATIYYTTNGATPTTASTQYSSAITVSTSETLQAIAVKTGYTNSAVATAAYTIAPVLPTPTFSSIAGNYSTSQSVTIADSTAGATIYYTTNGTTPTTASTIYSGAIAVSTNETLQAIAVETGYTNSAVATAAYTITPITPVLATPTFSSITGNYSTSQSVSIADSTAGATIYYTINGTTPTAASTLYSGAITVSTSETLEAIAVEAGYVNSPVASAAYTIAAPGDPVYISIANGGFIAGSMDLNNGAAITSGGLLEITDGGSGESRSAWFPTPVPVQDFVTDFTFQQLNANADGMTFTIQGQGAGALGGGGGSLGYQNIPTSVAIKFDLHSNAGEGINSTGLYTNGAAPTMPAVDLSSTGINLHSGDIMDAHMVYDGTNLTMTLTDTVTKATATEVFPVNIPAMVGANTAYVGFTGGTGGSTATQEVLSWTFSTP